MLSRINFIKIIKGHFATLRSLDQKTDTIYWQDFILFFIIPVSTSIFLTLKDFGFKEQVSNLIAAISILGGFLFNLLAIIYNSMSNLEADASKSKIKKKYIKEIHNNISFNILIAIFTILSLLFYNLDYPNNCYYWVLDRFLIFINYLFLITFLLTLLMVLNRVYILLNKNIEDK